MGYPTPVSADGMYRIDSKCTFSADACFYKPNADATKVNKSMISADGVFQKDMFLDCFGRKTRIFGRKIDENCCQITVFGTFSIRFAQLY